MSFFKVLSHLRVPLVPMRLVFFVSNITHRSNKLIKPFFGCEHMRVCIFKKAKETKRKHFKWHKMFKSLRLCQCEENIISMIQKWKKNHQQFVIHLHRRHYNGCTEKPRSLQHMLWPHSERIENNRSHLSSSEISFSNRLISWEIPTSSIHY